MTYRPCGSAECGQYVANASGQSTFAQSQIATLEQSEGVRSAGSIGISVQETDQPVGGSDPRSLAHIVVGDEVLVTRQPVDDVEHALMSIGRVGARGVVDKQASKGGERTSQSVSTAIVGMEVEKACHGTAVSPCVADAFHVERIRDVATSGIGVDEPLRGMGSSSWFTRHEPSENEVKGCLTSVVAVGIGGFETFELGDRRGVVRGDEIVVGSSVKDGLGEFGIMRRAGTCPQAEEDDADASGSDPTADEIV